MDKRCQTGWVGGFSHKNCLMRHTASHYLLTHNMKQVSTDVYTADTSMKRLARIATPPHTANLPLQDIVSRHSYYHNHHKGH